MTCIHCQQHTRECPAAATPRGCYLPACKGRIHTATQRHSCVTTPAVAEIEPKP